MSSNPFDFLREYVLSRYLPTQKLDEHDIKGFIKVWQNLLVVMGCSTKDKLNNFELLCGGVAGSVLTAYLRDDWVNRHLFYFGGLEKIGKVSPILRPVMSDSNLDRPTREVSLKALLNILEIAEALYNLQNCRGFEQRLLQAKKGNVEDNLTELQSAQILYEAGAYLEFVEPVNEIGKDYDLIAQLPNGVVVACEAKCKRENLDFTRDNFLATLGKARRQLPTDMPTLVMIKIPSHWAQDQYLDDAFASVLNTAFQGSTRLSGVLLFQDTIGTSRTERRYRFTQIENPNAAMLLINIQKFFGRDRRGGSWKHFHEILNIAPDGEGGYDD